MIFEHTVSALLKNFVSQKALDQNYEQSKGSLLPTCRYDAVQWLAEAPIRGFSAVPVWIPNYTFLSVQAIIITIAGTPIRHGAPKRGFVNHPIFQLGSLLLRFTITCFSFLFSPLPRYPASPSTALAAILTISTFLLFRPLTAPPAFYRDAFGYGSGLSHSPRAWLRYEEARLAEVVQSRQPAYRGSGDRRTSKSSREYHSVSR